MTAGKAKKKTRRRRLRLRHVLVGAATLVVAVAVALVAAIAALDPDELRATVERQAERATGRELTVAGPVDLALSLSPAVVLQDVRIANAAWGSRPAMATIERFELELALLPLIGGEVRVNRLVLVRPDVLLERNAEGQGNWAVMADGKAAGNGDATSIPQVRALRIEDATLAYRTPEGESARLQVARLTGRQARPDAPLEIDMEGRYQDLDVRMRGSLGAPARLTAGGPLPLDLTAETGGAKLTMKGQAAEPLGTARPDLQIEAAGESLALLGEALGVEGLPADAYRLGGRLTGGGERFSLEGLSLEIGESDLAGTVSLALTGPRPKLSGRVNGALLDLAALTGGASGKGDEEEGSYVFPATPLPLDGLEAIDLDLAFKVGTLRLDEALELSTVEGSLQAADGSLDLRVAKARLAGGSLAAKARIDASDGPPPVDLELKAEGVDYGRLLADLDVAQGVSGKADLAARLRGRGGSPRAIASSLSGDLEVVGGEGRIADSTLEVAGGGLQDLVQPWTERGEDMRLNCALARFDLADGIATSRVMLLDTDAVTLGGEGTVDLRDESLDLRVVPTAKQASLMSLAVPMRVTGRLSDPQVSPDALGAAKAGAIAFGTLVNPLATIGALILESQTAEQNPCVAALTKARADAAGDSGGADESASGGEAAAAPETRGEGGALGGVKGFLDDLGQSIDRTLGTDKP